MFKKLNRQKTTTLPAHHAALAPIALAHIVLTPLSLLAQEATSPVVPTPKTNKPNIILFLVDDMGWQDTSVPFHKEKTHFNHLYTTPNMEYLAENGVLFTQSYSAPVCSPTRTTLMTGETPARHQVTNWTLDPNKPEEGTHHNFYPPQWNYDGLQPKDAFTLAQGLQQAGYTTIHCGKAHWGGIGTAGEDPRNLGFDVNIAGHAAGAPGSYHGEDNFGNNKDGTPNKPWGVPGLEKYHGQKINLTDALTQEANLAINETIKKDKPFFLYMAHYAIHSPFMGHPKYLQKYLDIGLDKKEAAYASLIESMDASLGELITNLKEKGVAENTLIIFTSDNGGPTQKAGGRGKSPYGSNDTHNWPLREGKGSAYEGGTRVPTLISPAERTPSNFKWIGQKKRSDAIITSEDFYPTLLTIADFKEWEKVHQTLDGVNITTLFSGDPAGEEHQNRRIGFHLPHQWTHNLGTRKTGYQPHTTVRKGDWKIIYYYRSKKWELYNLATDIQEKNNLTKNSKQLEIMKKELKNFMEETKAQLPKGRNKKEHQIRY